MPYDPLHRVAARDPQPRLRAPARRPTACWRTAGSRAGTRQRSSAPIHQSSVQSSPTTVERAARVDSARPVAAERADDHRRSPHAAELGLRLAQHERGHDLGRRPALVEHRADLLGDRHLDAVTRRELEHRLRCSSRPRRPSSSRRRCRRACDPARARRRPSGSGSSRSCTWRRGRPCRRGRRTSAGRRRAPSRAGRARRARG